MIYITGDTHGDYYDLLNRIEPYSLGKDDILIVCGILVLSGDQSELSST